MHMYQDLKLKHVTERTKRVKFNKQNSNQQTETCKPHRG
jgi:hypothetical protein